MSDKIPNPQAPTQAPALSLLSLSIAAASAIPVPVPHHTKSSSFSGSSTASLSSAVTTNTNATTTTSSSSIGSSVKTHRRLSSTGRTRRRMSDARDAASRPLVNPSAHPNSVSLSLSTSSPTPPSIPPSTVTLPSAAQGTVEVKPIVIDGKTKRRGNEYKCESCSKVYRHPSCLIKHRWEHTPHWREASKFVLSKHQQVQLLEAAAILSHLSPDSRTGTSLPEDRSMWPSFLSGGSLPATAASVDNSHHCSTVSPPARSSSSPSSTSSTRSSIPPLTIKARSTSAGPRLHDYTLQSSNGGEASITHLRPGLIGVRATPSPATSNPGLSSHEEDEDDEEGDSLGDLEDDDDQMSVTFGDERDATKSVVSHGEWDGMMMDMDMD